MSDPAWVDREKYFDKLIDSTSKHAESINKHWLAVFLISVTGLLSEESKIWGVSVAGNEWLLYYLYAVSVMLVMISLVALRIKHMECLLALEHIGLSERLYDKNLLARDTYTLGAERFSFEVHDLNRTTFYDAMYLRIFQSYFTMSPITRVLRKSGGRQYGLFRTFSWAITPIFFVFLPFTISGYFFFRFFWEAVWITPVDPDIVVLASGCFMLMFIAAVAPILAHFRIQREWSRIMDVKNLNGL